MRIIDLHNPQSEPYIYVGRYAPYTKHGALQRSPLANPWRARNDYADSLKDCLAMYRRWLFGKIKDRDDKVMKALAGIDESSNLACWCCEKEGGEIFDDPEVCHAAIIWKAWRYLSRL